MPMDTKELPTSGQLSEELVRERKRAGRGRRLRSLLAVPLIVTAVVVLLTAFLTPILRIYGSSMEPTLSDGEVVLALKTTAPERGELCCFYVGGKVLCKRVIGKAGDVIFMDEVGNVTINGQPLQEPYLTAGALGACEIEFPYTVPENAYFVLGDNRETSIDSRHKEVGPVEQDQLIGKVIFRLWPFDRLGRC